MLDKSTAYVLAEGMYFFGQKPIRFQLVEISTACLTTSTQQLYFRSSYFPEQLLFSTCSETSFFRSSYFFRIASFSEQKSYSAAT